MGSRLGAVRACRAWLGSAKTHRSLALVDPRLTKTMERVRTGAVVDVPKGTVVVGDRRRAPQAGELVEMSRVRLGLVQATIQTTIFHGGWGQDHGGWRHETYTCPLLRILEITSHLPELVRNVSKTVFGRSQR